MSEWTYLKKGERRPVGRVLVAYVDEQHRRMMDTLYGDGINPLVSVAIAHWSKTTQQWMTERTSVSKVFAWMDIPAPPQQAPND